MGKSCSQVIYDLEDAPEEISKRNLCLTNPLDPAKNFNEIRASENISEKSVFKIQDITSTEYILVDSLDKIKKLSLDLAALKKLYINEDLLFIFGWNKLTDEEKDKKV